MRLKNNKNVNCIKEKTEMPLKLKGKSIISPDLHHVKAPSDPCNCAVFIEVEISERNKEGVDVFSFTAIYPKYMVANSVTSWGRGYLLMESFSWPEAESMLNKLLGFVREETWDGVAQNFVKSFIRNLRITKHTTTNKALQTTPKSSAAEFKRWGHNKIKDINYE